MAHVEVKGVRKAFDALEVIKGVDLNVKDREFVVFVGPSGCGKSTLLRMIAGLEEITAGDVLIDGVRVNDVPPDARGLAMVFQSYALYPHMSVADNMGFALRLAGVAREERHSKVLAAARILQLEPLLERKPGQLSGGQRVAMGRAIVRHPAVFLLDEPLSNLDAALRVQMRVELAKLHRDLKATMIYVTHDQVEAMTMADRSTRGASSRSARRSNSTIDPRNRFVAGFIGSPTMNFIDVKAMAVSDQGVAVQLPGGTTMTIPAAGASVSAGDTLTLGARGASEGCAVRRIGWPGDGVGALFQTGDGVALGEAGRSITIRGACHRERAGCAAVFRDDRPDFRPDDSLRQWRPLAVQKHLADELRDQSWRDGCSVDIPRQRLDRRLDARVGPVIANAVAEPEKPGESLVIVRGDIASPMDGVVVHRLLQDGEHLGRPGCDESILDRRHSDNGFAKSKAQRRADFQNCEMRCDKVGERGLGLKVGRMGLEDDARNAQDRRAQRRRFRLGVGEHLRIAHIDPGLNHQRDDFAYRIANPFFYEGRAMEIERSSGGLGSSHRQRVERLGLAPRNGNLRPDGIDEVPAGVRRFRDGAERRRAFGDRLFRQGAVVRAWHAGVEMNLGKAGLDIGPHHVAGLTHGVHHGLAFPGIGSEMIAAQDDPG